jgi:hypothetical protein
MSLEYNEEEEEEEVIKKQTGPTLVTMRTEKSGAAFKRDY